MVDSLLDELAIDNNEEAMAYFQWLWYCSRSLLSRPWNWAAVQALAQDLLQRGEVGERRARRIIGEAFDEALKVQG